MSEMVERVAAVIAAEIMELTADQRARFQFPDDANGDTCDRARSAARAAIEAMREPTEGMVNRALIVNLKTSADRPCSTYLYDEEARAIWRDQIDEALK